jgi:hypothetical protein
MPTRNRYEQFQWSSLSQKLAWKMPEYENYAGTDPVISDQLATIEVMIRHGLIRKTPKVIFMVDLLNEKRKAAFATSEKVNEITKMGLQMRKEEIEYGANED